MEEEAAPKRFVLNFLGDQPNSFFLDFERYDFEAEFDLFAEYLENMEAFLSGEEKHYAAAIEELWKTTTTDSDERLEVQHGYEYGLDRVDAFRNVLRRSFFVNLFSELESRLVTECDSRREADSGIGLGLSDLSGKEIVDKVKTYFAKVLKAYFPSDTAEWNEIQNYRKLRNCLVHSRGNVSASRNEKDLRSYVASKKGLLSLKDDELCLTKEFCHGAHKTIKGFLLVLLFPGRRTGPIERD